MFSTPDFWVFVAFILFLCVFGKRAFSAWKASLEKHTQNIADQLDEAQELHDEALSLLNTYKKKHADALVQAQQMISAAEAEAMAFKESSAAEFKKLLDQKENALRERMAIKTEEIKTQLKNQAVDDALVIVKKVLAKEKKEGVSLTQKSLKEVSLLPLTSEERLIK